MVEVKDKTLYESVKKKVYTDYPKHSAYRSGLLVKKYKEAYLKKHKSKDAYKGDKDINQGLSRWFREEWKNQRGEEGYKQKGDIYRPTKKLNKHTPKTYNELSKYDIEKARKEKKKNGRVKRF